MKKYILTIIIFLILIISFFLVYPKKNKEILATKENKSNFLSIMLENGVGTNNYQETNDFPSTGYVLNKTLSKCENGSKIKYEDGSIYISGNKMDRCYAYFDNIQVKTDFSFTGTYEEYIVPTTGTYKIELWGASGGNAESIQGGKGAYVKGNIKLTKSAILYIFIGEMGNGHIINTERTDFTYPLTFNGGGEAHEHMWTAAASGGGATDIRLEVASNGSWEDFNSLKSRIMVAAGGGGGLSYVTFSDGGYGGALEGGEGRISYIPDTADNRVLENTTGGTQTHGGETNDRKTIIANGKFGVGGSYYGSSSSGGGSGYYGGAGGIDQVQAISSGAGGSSFISGYPGCNAIAESSTEDTIVHTGQPIHYSGKIFTDSEMLAGNTTMPSPDGATEEGHTGNGYAKITLIK